MIDKFNMATVTLPKMMEKDSRKMKEREYEKNNNIKKTTPSYRVGLMPGLGPASSPSYNAKNKPEV